jgi:hypothetical protein
MPGVRRLRLMYVKWFNRSSLQDKIVSGLVVQNNLEGRLYGACAHPVLQGLSVVPT